jgi:LuxR family transcriptional regulator, maltose regulon positive regulatory protein
LQLAALSLRTHQDPIAWISQFSGSHRFILDYVQQEILERQPLGVQHFLLRTSVLTFLRADLCQQLSGESASQHMLEVLERTNLFVVPFDEERRWYRYHPLFREALLSCLQASEPEQVLLLHRRASAWYTEQDLLPEAITHALAANDFAYAASLIEHFLVPQSWRNAYHMLRRWLSRLPDEVLRTHPGLSFLFARAMLLASQSEPSTWRLMENPLRLAEQGYREAGDQAGEGSVLTTRAVLTGFQGDFAASFALARAALILLPPEETQWRGECLSILATEAAFSGQYEFAESLLQQALACHDASGSLPGRQYTVLMLGEVCLARGDLDLAASFFRQVISVSTEQPDLARDQLMDETGGRRAHFEGLAWYSLGHLAYLHNDLAQAHHALQEGLGQGWFALLHILTPGLLLQVRLLHAQGEIEQARTFLADLLAKGGRPEVLRGIRLCQAWLALSMGDLTRAQRWAEGLVQTSTPLALVRREEEVLLLARLRIYQGQPEVATLLLAPILREARAQARLHSELQILILSALAEVAGSALRQARKTLLQAVTRARHAGYQRLFLEEGQPMEMLLKRLLPGVREQALAFYVRDLLRAFGSVPVRALASPVQDTSLLLDALTPQERRVLGLLAEGASNQDIARVLVISLATARKHVSNILSKLGAENRTQAVARARQYALL